MRGDTAKSDDDAPLGCDTEEGAVWIHVGLRGVRVTPQGAIEFAAQLHECAREAAKHG